MSDVDNATISVAQSDTAAPPPASDTQGSAPAPVDTTVSGQDQQKGQEPDKQSRRDSRAFATLRRENRDLYRRLGGMETLIAQLTQAPPSQPEGQPDQGQKKPAPADHAADRRSQAATDAFLERLEDAGDSIEGFDKVIETITAQNFPGTVAMRDFILESDKPAEMAKWLADNPKEAQRISLLSEVGQWKALERAESKLSTKPAPRSTGAPPPVRTVGGSPATGHDPYSNKNMSTDDYMEWRRKQSA